VFDLRSQSRLIPTIAQIEGRDASLVIDGGLQRVSAARVTDELLTLLATPLALGRPLITSEDAAGITVTGVVISHELWQRHFNGDPGVIGRLWRSTTSIREWSASRGRDFGWCCRPRTMSKSAWMCSCRARSDQVSSTAGCR
jgi:hypothetical protein